MLAPAAAPDPFVLISQVSTGGIGRFDVQGFTNVGQARSVASKLWFCWVLFERTDSDDVQEIARGGIGFAHNSILLYARSMNEETRLDMTSEPSPTPYPFALISEVNTGRFNVQGFTDADEALSEASKLWFCWVLFERADDDAVKEIARGGIGFAHNSIWAYARSMFKPPESRPVRLGMADVIWPFATHWAVQVQDVWFEVEGASKQETNSKMAIVTSRGEQSQVGAHLHRFGHVGETSKSDREISVWIDEWKASNPTYNFTSDNCQKFARELIGWLTDGAHKPLPMMDAGVGANSARGPNAWAGAEGGAAYAGATVANMQGHNGILNGALDAPNASAAALCGREGFGAFSEAELGRAEGGIGPIRVAAHLNANTSIGFRNHGLEISVIGFGVKAGANGISASIPVFTIGIGRR